MPRKSKSWSYSAGEKGRNRVRGFARPGRPDCFMLQYSSPDSAGRATPRRVAVNVDPTDDTRAQHAEVKRKVDELVAKLAEMPAVAPEPRVTLGGLATRYLVEVTPTKALGTQTNDRIALGLAVKAWGRDRDPLTLDRSDWDAYIRLRQAGQLHTDSKRKRANPSRAVGKNTVANELRIISALLSWAAMLRTSRGKPFLAFHPFRGFVRPKEIEPAQPRVTEADYRAMLRVAPRVHSQCSLALRLAFETGHRAAAIRSLEWRDIDLAARTVTWRAATDKTRTEHTNPLTDEAVSALTGERNRQAVIGNAATPIFPSPSEATKAVCASLFRRWIVECAQLAELEAAKRFGWHAFRRRFADDIRDLPLKDAAALGGWKSPRMLLEIYQSTNVESQRTALDRRRRDAVGTTLQVER